MPWAKIKKGQMISVQDQGSLYSAWSADNPGKANPGAAPHAIGLPAASTAALEPGDVFSLVSQATPSRGRRARQARARAHHGLGLALEGTPSEVRIQRVNVDIGRHGDVDVGGYQLVPYGLALRISDV
jgi:hypothetical protein